MLIGVFFLLIWIFIYIKENYEINILEGKRVFIKKEKVIKHRNYRYKILTSIFSLSLGIFMFLSLILY